MDQIRVKIFLYTYRDAKIQISQSELCSREKWVDPVWAETTDKKLIDQEDESYKYAHT